MKLRVRVAFALCTLAICTAAHVARAQDNLCGITPQSARTIAFEMIKQTEHAYDSISSAYYVSVLASRLSPYYVVFFYLKGMVVGEIEVDLCGRGGTPHPGLRYVAESDLPASRLILEPDQAFAKLKAATGKTAAFGSRVFPFGVVHAPAELEAIDFWWFLLDETGTWHYLNRLGEPVKPAPK